MRAGLLIMLLIGFGCAGPEAPPTRDVVESHRDTCPSRRVPSERDRAIEGRCLSQSVGWGLAGEALSGAATAVRMP
jgi:hypothetical protein